MLRPDRYILQGLLAYGIAVAFQGNWRRSSVLASIQDLVGALAAFACDDILVGCLGVATATGSFHFNESLSLQEAQDTVSDVGEWQPNGFRNFIAGHVARKIESLEHQIREEAHIEPGLFDRARCTWFECLCR